MQVDNDKNHRQQTDNLKAENVSLVFAMSSDRGEIIKGKHSPGLNSHGAKAYVTPQTLASLVSKQGQHRKQRLLATGLE